MIKFIFYFEFDFYFYVIKFCQEKKKTIFANGETAEFSGRIIVKMAQDPNIMKYSSKVVIGAG